MSLENTYSRGIDTCTLRILGKEGERNVRVGDVLKTFSAAECTRIHMDDYPEKAKRGDIISHVNLPLEFDRVLGSTEILSRIIVPGCFIFPKTEVLPLLSFHKVWLVEVISFFRHTGYGNLPDRFFNNLIGGAKDVPSLMEMVFRRYSKSLPGLSRGEILDQGLSITFYRLIQQVSWE